MSKMIKTNTKISEDTSGGGNICFFFLQAEDGIRYSSVTGVQTCALPISRDRRGGRAQLGDLAFGVIDTAGLEEAAPESLSGRMQEQTEAAIAGADAILFLIDARAGSLPADRPFAYLVPRSGKPPALLPNQCHGSAAAPRVLHAYQ